MTSGFNSRQFVVTGGAGGIGRLCARQLLEAGARVHLVDIEAGRLDAVRGELDAHGEVTTHVSRLESPAEAAAALDAAGRPIGGIVHMAGVFEADPEDADEHGVWNRALQANLTNGYDLAMAYAKRRDESAVGRLVFCSSGAFRRGAPLYVAYSAAKGGVVGLTRALSRKLAPHTLVNCVAPNAIRTPMTDVAFRDRGEAILSTIPLGRFGEPEEIASVVTFLCGDGASYVNGQTINVCGGVTNG